MNIDEVTEKLRKILALAGDKAATQGEVEAAMGKAKEIALRHNLELSSISLNKDTGASKTQLKVEKHQMKVRSQNQQKYHRWIFASLSDCFGVRVIVAGPYFWFVGETVDVLICKELFPWLENVFYQTYWKAKKLGIAVSCAADKNGIYMGLYRGIREANRREEEKLNTQEKQCMALMLVDKKALVDAKVEEEFPELRKARRTSLEVNPRAHQHGYNEGKKINLRQTGAGSTTKGQIGE